LILGKLGRVGFNLLGQHQILLLVAQGSPASQDSPCARLAGCSKSPGCWGIGALTTGLAGGETPGLHGVSVRLAQVVAPMQQFCPGMSLCRQSCLSALSRGWRIAANLSI
jgi:hypothetical protein